MSRVFRESKPRRLRSENRLKSKLLGNLPLWKSTSILVGKSLSQVIPGLTQWISLRFGRPPNPTIFRIELEFDARSSRLDILEKSVTAKTPEEKYRPLNLERLRTTRKSKLIQEFLTSSVVTKGAQLSRRSALFASRLAFNGCPFAQGQPITVNPTPSEVSKSTKGAR